jgi:hypothetical protein
MMMQKDVLENMMTMLIVDNMRRKDALVEMKTSVADHNH